MADFTPTVLNPGPAGLLQTTPPIQPVSDKESQKLITSQTDLLKAIAKNTKKGFRITGR